MTPINIIDGLILTSDGDLKAVGKGSPGNVFLRQGDLDGACAVYSMMMCLILHKKITYNKLVGKTSEKGYTGLRRLQKEFLEGKHGLYRDGFLFHNLSDLLKHAFSKHATSYAYATSGKYENITKTELCKTLIEELDNGCAAEIGFTRKGHKSGHAVVAVGYQMMQNAIRVFCLDPGYPMLDLAMWNTIIDIKTDSAEGNRQYSDINLNPNENDKINVDELLVFR